MSKLDDPLSTKLQDAAYDTLNEYFIEHQDEVINITVLPPGMPFDSDVLIMQDGPTMGVPKSTLVLAFLRARRIFLEAEKVLRLEASRVILLFDPEYITATNLRKRRILGLVAKKCESGWDEYKKTLGRETIFLNSILTSPLHRQSKSPTLWHHRAWLLEFISLTKLAEPSPDSFLLFARAELDAVLKAGEQHPKNYYAWQYARTLFEKLDIMFLDETEHFWKSAYHAFLTTCALLVKAWCCKHVSDVSGLSFLFFLLPRLKSVSRRRRIVRDVLDYTEKLRLDQESLWTFLRTTLASAVLEGERDALTQQLRNYQLERILGEQGKDEENRVTAAVKWIDMYSISLLNSPSVETGSTEKPIGPSSIMSTESKK
ncbi:uncharacterized protein BDR25DRAFT_22623 [Lindgomyces ingoldianus]|uniref:Uncharacterized protein n=1 Tax=Lindgomyces ingoldianus TaxID=673940 RepID=A0ACB6QYV6_9PLEO|nr:uncharacterized protein BDR25DRAFT_22623 [Lindgomyces ingoldianus]KAF2471743.1 hypothetical protein BDR25DRAFT_22623 [Lindgomyces ingoldianus]